MTGASGILYARRLCQALAEEGGRVHLVMTEAGAQVLREELGAEVDLGDGKSVIRGLVGSVPGNFRYEHHKDIGAAPASGSYRVDGMVVIPCTTGTLGGIAAGISRNLVERTADVMLKERRNLILVVRETPLSAVALENMLKLTHAGACILPAMPGFYHLPETVGDLVDFVVGKVLTQLGLDHELIRRKVKRRDQGG